MKLDNESTKRFLWNLQPRTTLILPGIIHMAGIRFVRVYARRFRAFGHSKCKVESPSFTVRINRLLLNVYQAILYDQIIQKF
jgi:hypothetical protein